MLSGEKILVQDWDRSHVIRDHYRALLGPNAHLEAHPAGKQGLFMLVSAGYGVTLSPISQTESGFPGVIFRPLSGTNAHIQICLGWSPQCQDPATGRFVAFVRDFMKSREPPGRSGLSAGGEKPGPSP